MTKLSASIFSRLRAMAGLLLVSATHLHAASTTHVVAKGDTLSGLALKYDCSVQVLKDLNRLNSDVIVIGRTLRLPDAEMEGGAVKFVHRQDRIVVNTRQAPALVNREVLEQSNGENTSVVVDVIRQRIYLLVKGRVAIDSPISTGRPGHPTPRGMFVITERVQSGKISNRYGSLMPNWMRLGNTAVGMHTGKLPGKPDSHGCIRLPDMIAPIIFSHTKAGTSVRVLDSWTLPASDVAAR